MSTATPDAVYKIVLIGDAGVGKTSILQRFAHEKRGITGILDIKACKPTIGVEFESFDIERLVNEKKYLIRVQIWDTAGQERYRAITKSQYRRANGAMVVFDVSKKVSFEHAKKVWLPELEDTATDTTGLSKAIAFVCNKTDLRVDATDDHKKFNFVDPDQTKAFTNERNDEEKIEVFDTSALKGTGLKTKTLEDGKKNVFLHLIDKIHKFHLEKSGVLEYAKSGNAIDLSGQKSQNGPCGGSKC
jgi:small GTP-binding protein